MPKKAELILTTVYSAQTPAQRLLWHSFTAGELQILSRNLVFKERLIRMDTIDDACHLIDLGASLIKKMVKRGEWLNNPTEHSHLSENFTVEKAIKPFRGNKTETRASGTICA